MKVSVLILLVLTGCADTRQTAKLAAQAQQANVATARIAQRLQASEMTPEQRKSVEKILALAQRCAEAMGPVVRVLGGAPEVQTSAEQAEADTPSFTTAMAVQQGKAEIEAEAVEHQNWIMEQTALVGSNLLSQLLLGLGGTGAVGAGILKLWNTFSQYKKGVKDAVDCGEDLANAGTPEQIKMVKQKHALRQQKNGTKTIIEKALS